MGRSDTAADTSDGSSTEHLLFIESSRLVPFIEGMKVCELATLAGISVDALVAGVVRAAGLLDSPGLRMPRRRSKSAPVVATVHSVESKLEPEPEPELGPLLGRATWRELEVVVDRWVLGRVLAAYEWNITHAAARLALSRRWLRERWAVVRAHPIMTSLAKPASSEPAWDRPKSPSLGTLLDQGATFRQIHQVIDRWIVEHTLADEDGNVMRSAKLLDISRRRLRAMRDSAAEGS